MSKKNPLVFFIILTYIQIFPTVFTTADLINSNPVDSLFNAAFETELECYMNDSWEPFSNFALSVVQGNESVYAKTWGEWELDTLIHIQSIAKTFTGVLIMQLYEQGLLDFDDDVNLYLNVSYRNPSFPDIPITIHHCLSHQTSRDDGVTWLNSAPGTVCNYANENFYILGCIIENITGTSFHPFLIDNILTPLNITNYEFLSGERIGVAGLMLSAVDMMKWSITILNNGTYKGTEILSNDSMQLMKEKHAFVAEDHYFGYTFHVTGPNANFCPNLNVRMIGHPGSPLPFSQFFVCHQHNVSCFFSADREFNIRNVDQTTWFSLIEFILNTVFQLSEEYTPVTIIPRPIRTSTTTATTTTTTAHSTPVSLLLPLVLVPIILMRKRER